MMLVTRPDRRQHFMRRTGVALLLMLALSVAGHFWHHLTDAACENPDQGLPHACAQCSALHGGVLAEDLQRAASPHLSVLACVLHQEDADRVAELHTEGSPRAPPLA
jgi:hypothetical protein